MTQISNYIKDLPPVLWSKDYDPDQVLGRMLCIFEKILTGIPQDTKITTWVEAEALFNSVRVNTTGDPIITLSDATAAAQFQTKDIVTIGGVERRFEIADISGAEITLSPLTSLPIGRIPATGSVHIATFSKGELANASGLTSGMMIEIQQGDKQETQIIHAIDGNFVTLKGDLQYAYPLEQDEVRVRSQDDKTPLEIDGKTYPPLKTTIDQIAHLLNPWQAPTEFLPELAAWVGLTLKDDWSEYQKRKLIAEIVPLYQQRGLKQGLLAYLDIFAASEARPRIAIDDSEALFRAEFLNDGTAKLHAFAFSQTVELPDTIGSTLETVTQTILLHPSGIAVDSNNNYIVASHKNENTPYSDIEPGEEASLWCVSHEGNVDYESGSLLPQPKPIKKGDPLTTPRAVVIDSSDRYIVLDSGKIIFFNGPNYLTYDELNINNLEYDGERIGGTPIDLALDENDLVLLYSQPPQVVVICDDGTGTALVLDKFDLDSNFTATAVVKEETRCYIISAFRNDAPAAEPEPADLIRVNLNDGRSESLLNDYLRSHPLIWPTGLTFGWRSNNHLFICDNGLRDIKDSDEPLCRYLAEPAGIYRVDIGPPPTISPIITTRKLVSPTHLTFDQKGNLIISDYGSYIEGEDGRNWRVRENEIGITINFSGNRPYTPQIRLKNSRSIGLTVKEYRPNHCVSWQTT